MSDMEQKMQDAIEGGLHEQEECYKEIERLKIKCNVYAKRLVCLGEDDVSWELSEVIINE